MSLPPFAHDASFARAARAALVRAGVAGMLACVAGCGEDAPLQQAFEDYWVVGGVPRDRVSPPIVDERPPAQGPFHPSRPHRCDTIPQASQRRVDVLWVIDDSPSMEAEQQLLASRAAAILERLGRTPGADFHIGVVTTDVEPAASSDTGPGWLRRVPGTSLRYLACTSEPGAGAQVNVRCDGITGSPEAALRGLLQPGTGGSTQEKGLLAAMLALSEPLRTGVNAGFLRDDAALSLIFMSDEDDASCGPYVEDASRCVAHPSCRCEDAPAWGSMAYYERFFRGLKGYGNEDSVRIGAIVAAETNPLRFYDDTERAYVGCTSDPDVDCAVPERNPDGAACAFHAPRYLGVADPGSVVSICAADSTAALDALPLEGSGLLTDFALGRVAVPETIDIAIVQRSQVSCEDAAPCSEEGFTCVDGRCVKHVGGHSQEWEYVICSGGTQRNVVRFSGRSIPEPSHDIEVCYDVDVGHDSQCQSL